MSEDDVRRQAETAARAFLDKVEVRRSQQKASVQAAYEPSVVTVHQDVDEKFIQPPDASSSTVSVGGGSSPPGDGGIPDCPGDGTFVLACVGGELTWLDTDDCSDDGG